MWILDRALLEIDLLVRTHEHDGTLELRSLYATAQHVVTRSIHLVKAFLERMRRYQSTLDPGEKPNVIQGMARKVQWRIGEKEALDQFRVEIAGTSSSLQMLLATASVYVLIPPPILRLTQRRTLLNINRKELEARFDLADQRVEMTSSSQGAVLHDIQACIEEVNEGIAAGNSILGKVTDVFRLDWLQQLGSELKCLLHRSIAVNFATYQALIAHHSSLPSRLELKWHDRGRGNGRSYLVSELK